MMFVFSALATVFILTAVYRLYLTQMLTIRWRKWLTEQYFFNWFEEKKYFKLEQGANTDNPDQRLTDDIRSFTSTTLGLGLGLLTNIVSLISFSIILWDISGSIEFLGVNIPGYMFWIALVYAIVGSWLAHVVARRLIGLNNRQERFEADLRNIKLAKHGKRVPHRSQYP